MIDSHGSLVFFIALITLGALFLTVSFANGNRVKENSLYIVALAIFTLFGASYFRFGFGYDYDSYLSLFDSLPDCNCYLKGPLFFYGMYFLKSLGVSFDFFLALVSSISIALLFSVIKRVLNQNILFPLLIIISLYFFVSLMGQVRQFFAISVAAYSIINIRRVDLSVVAFLISVLVHPSVLVLAPGYYFFRRSLLPPVFVPFILIFGTFLLGYMGVIFNVISLFFDVPVLGVYAVKISNYHENWISSGTSLSLYTVVLTQAIFFSAYRRISKDAFARGLYVISLSGSLLVFILYQDSHIYGRIIKIFRIFDFLLIFRILYVGGYSPGFKLAVNILILLFAISFLIKDYLRLQSL